MASIPEKVLNDLVSGNVKVDLEFLALKIMLARMQNKIRIDPRPATLQNCTNELSSFLTKFGHLPITQKDIAEIMKGRS